MYDDVLLNLTISSLDDCYQLQADLNTLEYWANKWRMVFNPSKCELPIKFILSQRNIIYNIILLLIKEEQS